MHLDIDQLGMLRWYADCMLGEKSLCIINKLCIIYIDKKGKPFVLFARKEKVHTRRVLHS